MRYIAPLASLLFVVIACAALLNFKDASPLEAELVVNRLLPGQAEQQVELRDVESFKDKATDDDPPDLPAVTAIQPRPRALSTRLRIHSGELTRDNFEGDYDDALLKIARSDIKRASDAGEQRRAANIAGFETWDELNRAISGGDVRFIDRKDELEQIVNKSILLAAESHFLLEDVWTLGAGVDIWNPKVDAREDRRLFMEELGKQYSDSYLEFGYTASIGDRAFNLHFCSKMFPEFELKLRQFGSARDAFWKSLE